MARDRFPALVLSKLFRGKLLASLAAAYQDSQLDLGGSCAELADPQAFARLKDQLYRTSWVAYCKAPFAGPEQVFRYLGRYTHRVGLSNQRLLALSEDGVLFRTKGDGTALLRADEFIGRFLQHVLPPRFVKIRHYGLHAPANVTTRLVRTDAGPRRLLPLAQTGRHVEPSASPRGPLAPDVPPRLCSTRRLAQPSRCRTTPRARAGYAKRLLVRAYLFWCRSGCDCSPIRSRVASSRS